MNLHAVVSHVDRDIGHMQEVIGKILLDDIALVAQADDKIVDAVGRKYFHDVPDDRFTADLDHRLRLEMRFLADSRA